MHTHRPNAYDYCHALVWFTQLPKQGQCFYFHVCKFWWLSFCIVGYKNNVHLKCHNNFYPLQHNCLELHGFGWKWWHDMKHEICCKRYLSAQPPTLLSYFNRSQSYYGQIYKIRDQRDNTFRVLNRTDPPPPLITFHHFLPYPSSSLKVKSVMEITIKVKMSVNKQVSVSVLISSELGKSLSLSIGIAHQVSVSKIGISRFQSQSQYQNY